MNHLVGDRDHARALDDTDVGVVDGREDGRRHAAGEAALPQAQVLRAGERPAAELAAGECAKGVAQVSLEANMPIAFGVLTTNTVEQAVERAGTKGGNKGADAAMTVIEMINLLKKLRA